MPFRFPFFGPRRSQQLPARVLDVNQMKRLVQKEQARSDRSLLPVSLIRLEFEDRQSDRSPETIRRVYQLCINRIRETDEIGEIDAERIAILLPDTPLEGSEVLADDLRTRAQSVGIYLQYTLDSYPLEEDQPADHSGGASGLADSPASDHEFHRSRTLALDSSGASLTKVKSATSLKQHAERIAVQRGQSVLAERFVEDASLAAGGQVRRTDKVARQLSAPAPHLQFAEELFDVGRFTPGWKRTIDIVGSVVGLVVLSPVLVTAWLLIRITSPGPGIYTQVRDGHLGRPFTIYKFRTMRLGAEKEQSQLLSQNEQDGPAFKLSDDPRVTRIGAILRRTCIDELPQLWNVLRGEMSLVGPRPLPCDESAQCTTWQSRRLLVKPGLTCYWQTYRSNEIPFADWMRMDLQYARRMSLRTDLQLVAATILSIAGKRPVFNADPQHSFRKENNHSITVTS